MAGKSCRTISIPTKTMFTCSPILPSFCARRVTTQRPFDTTRPSRQGRSPSSSDPLRTKVSDPSPLPTGVTYIPQHIFPSASDPPKRNHPNPNPDPAAPLPPPTHRLHPVRPVAGVPRACLHQLVRVDSVHASHDASPSRRATDIGGRVVPTIQTGSTAARGGCDSTSSSP